MTVILTHLFKLLRFFHLYVLFFTHLSYHNLSQLGLTKILRYSAFQNGGRLPTWIFKIGSFCHVAFVGMPFCFLVQIFAEIGQTVDELWP